MISLQLFHQKTISKIKIITDRKKEIGSVSIFFYFYKIEEWHLYYQFANK